MRRLLIKFLVLILLTGSGLSAQKKTEIPAPRHTLDSLKKEDNLSQWIYLRLDYVYPEPQLRLPFLLASQQQAWRKPKTDEEKVAWLLLLSTQGYYQLQTGNIMGSINCYEAAHKYYMANNTIDFDITEYIYKPLSNNYTRLGDYERAVYVQRSTLNFAQKLNNKELISSTRGNLAISYRSMGRFEKALGQITEGLKTTGPGTENGITLNNIKADILFDLQNYPAAEMVIKENIGIQHTGKINGDKAYNLFGSYVSLGNILFKRAELKNAKKAYENALGLLNRYYPNERQRERANIFNQLGKIGLVQKNPLVALDYFNRSLRIFGVTGENNKVIPGKIYGDNNVIDALSSRSAAYLLLNEPDKALGEIWYSLAAADKIRFELADEKTRQRFQKDTKTIAERAIEMAFDQYKRTGKENYAITILNIAEQSKARTLLDAVRKNQQQIILKNNDSLLSKRQLLERTIIFNERQQVLNPAGAVSNAKNLYELSLVENELRKKYPAWTARGGLSYEDGLDNPIFRTGNQDILEYFTGDSSIYAIHNKGNQVIAVERLRHAAGIKTQVITYVRTYFNNGPDAMLNNPKAFYQASFNIYNMIVPKSLKNVKHFTIIPDGVIGYLSFDGLVTDSNYRESISKWPYLIKRSVVSYAFSMQTMLKPQQTEDPASTFTGFFISHQNGSTYLPAVKEEADAIKKVVKGRFFFDEEANAGNLFNAINRGGILHLSTHAGLFGPDLVPSIDMESRKVFLFELLARGNAPDLVVLSACQTANGILQNGEGIISFSRGFAALGAKGTVAGLWNLNDEAAARIMGQFYKNLSAGLNVSAALHQAKLDQLNSQGNSEAQYLPYYWNALVYMGSNQQLYLKPANRFVPLLIGSLIFLISVSAIVYAVKKEKKKK